MNILRNLICRGHGEYQYNASLHAALVKQSDQQHVFIISSFITNPGSRDPHGSEMGTSKETHSKEECWGLVAEAPINSPIESGGPEILLASSKIGAPQDPQSLTPCTK